MSRANVLSDTSTRKTPKPLTLTCKCNLCGPRWTESVACETRAVNLFVVFRRGAQNSELRAAGFGFGGLAGVEEGLDERLQMLSFLTENRSCLHLYYVHSQKCQDQIYLLQLKGFIWHDSVSDAHFTCILTSFISLLGTALMILPVKEHVILVMHGPATWCVQYLLVPTQGQTDHVQIQSRFNRNVPHTVPRLTSGSILSRN